MTRHQYGISALVSQTSFRGETVGGVAKCRLFTQATFFVKNGTQKGKGLDCGAEPPRINICWVPPPPQPPALPCMLFKILVKVKYCANKLVENLRYCTLRFVHLRKHSPNSRSRPPSCLLAVFAIFLAIISPSSSCSSYSWNEWNIRHFFFQNSTSSSSLLGNGALNCSRLHF